MEVEKELQTTTETENKLHEIKIPRKLLKNMFIVTTITPFKNYPEENIGCIPECEECTGTLQCCANLSCKYHAVHGRNTCVARMNTL